MPTRSDEFNRGRFGLGALALAVLLLLVPSALSFLRSNPGRRIFADSATAIDLKSTAKGAVEQEDGTLVVPGSADSETQLRPSLALLGRTSLAPGTSYLLVARSGRAGFFAVDVTDPSSGRRRRFRFSAQHLDAEQQHVVRVGWSSGTGIWRLVYGGRTDLRVRELTLHRLSPLYGWLLRLLPVLAALGVAAFLFRHRRRLRHALREPRRLDDVVFAGATFAICMFVFYRADVVQILDSRYQTAVSHRLLHAGTSDLGEIVSRPEGGRLPRQLLSVDGKIRPFYPVAPALLDAPIVAGFELFGVSPVTPAGGFDRRNEVRIMRFSAALIAAALCTIFYLLARELLPPGYSLALALAFAFGTQVFSTVSRPYWTHAWALLLCATAIWAVAWPRRQGAAWAALGATCISWAFFCRPTMVISVVGLTLLACARYRGRPLWTYLGVGAGWAALFVVYSQLTLGSWLPRYFFTQQVNKGLLGADRMASPSRFWDVLGALVSPSRGLLIYVPLVAWIVVVVLLCWRRVEDRRLAIVSLGVVSAHVLLLSLTQAWMGGQSYGPRQASDVLAWFFLLGILAVHAVIGGWREWGTAVRWTTASTLIVTLAFSLFVNIRGAVAPATIRWKAFDRPPAWFVEGREPRLEPGRLWNWRYPQFMAGLLPPDRDRTRDADSQER